MRFLIPVLLGAVAATGFAPLQLVPLTIVAVALWLRMVHDAPTLKRAMLTGWLFGVGHFTVNNNWIQHAFDYQDKMPPVLGYGAAVGLALYLAVYPMLTAGLVWRLASPRSRGDAQTAPGLSFALVAGAGWIAGEWLRSTLFTGYAWDPLAVAWVPVQPIAWVTTLVGTYALSGLTVTAASLLLMVPRRPLALALAALAVLLPVPLAALSYRARPAPQPPTAPRLRVVQPNIDQQAHIDRDDWRATSARLAALSGTPGRAPRLVLWPEGIVQPYLEDGYPYEWYLKFGSPIAARAQIARLLGPNDRALVGGTALMFDAAGEITQAGNSVFVVTPDARLDGRYDKAHLVPGGEYLPMRALTEPLGLSRLVAGDIDFADGPGPRSIDIAPFGAIGFQVCYEIIFSGQVVDPARRPRLIFNPSNDAWFGSWGPVQHLAQARLRAIEEGVPVVRSTPNGVSAVIGADGALIAQVPHFTAGAIDVAIPPAHAPTPFSRIGNWAALVVALLLLAAARILRRR
ncbi:acyltransferase [Sphingomonas sp. Leaf33]|uniref:apolipoprotein N-acyltransferase n=1 Tax=Sphingomonas sp. Leaf33 TaxID=1736215 RepID=UPI0006FF3679|nr:apolipoprotein N-acyltransferase [Sphingomonas sp. Leaf33]KQN25056.1 acyltransferase [Sphingomonas sp. Leaf33]